MADDVVLAFVGVLHFIDLHQIELSGPPFGRFGESVNAARARYTSPPKSTPPRSFSAVDNDVPMAPD